jgi:hypothetical protein
MTIIRVPVPADGGTSQRWGEWAPLRRPPPADELLLDLSDVEFVDPFFLVRLRGFIDLHCSNGIPMTIEPPKSSAVRTYLERMDLAGNLPAGCASGLQARPAVAGNVLIPIRRLGSTSDVDLMLDGEIATLLDAQFTNSLAGLGLAFTATVSEMCDNATTHGHSNVGTAYVAAQRYSAGRCVLVVGDLGIGIPAHIRRQHPTLLTDDDAIREATKEGVTGATGSNRNHRGIGYQWVIDSLKEANIPFGELRVWSGRGRFRVEVRDGLQLRRRAWGVEGETAGTWVRLELRAR